MDKIPGRVISFLSAILIAVSSVSCVEELAVDRNSDVEEGLPVQMTLDFLSQRNRVETRAAQDETYENRVNNLYVFIFNQAGEVHYKKFFGTTDISYGSTSYSNGSISIETTSLNSARVVCIANLSTTEVSSGYEVSSDVMDGITSLAELEAYVMELTENTIERSSQFMMTGYAYDDAGSNLINIPGTEDGSSSFECTLRPERTDAKVEFVVKTEIPEDKVGSWTNFDFRPSGWRVVNVPAQSLLLPRETGDADDSYFTTDEMPFETIERDENYLYTSGGFVFYMPENRKTPKQNISGDGLTSDEMYAMREERDHQNTDGSFPDRPGQKFENGSFTYAPDNATYVEMSGTLSYMDKNYAVNAEVTFTVHLGYSGGDCNDYDTRRNTHYIYNVTLRGINDIKVEVTEDEETEYRPGYEGDVIYSRQGNLYDTRAARHARHHLPRGAGADTGAHPHGKRHRDIPLLGQPRHDAAGRRAHRLGRRAVACHAGTQGDAGTAHAAADHHLRRNRHGRFGAHRRRDGRNHRLAGRRNAGGRHHPPAAGRLEGRSALRGLQARRPHLHHAADGRGADDRNRQDALGQPHHRCSPLAGPHPARTTRASGTAARRQEPDSLLTHRRPGRVAAPLPSAATPRKGLRGSSFGDLFLLSPGADGWLQRPERPREERGQPLRMGGTEKERTALERRHRKGLRPKEQGLAEMKAGRTAKRRSRRRKKETAAQNKAGQRRHTTDGTDFFGGRFVFCRISASYE